MRLQAVEKIRGALRVGGCAEDGAFVFLQHVEPVPEIGGVVVPDLRRDAEVGAQESGSQLRYQFLAGVTLVAETLRAEIAVKAALVPRPVRQFMQGGGVIALLVPEGLEGRKLDGVTRGRVKGAVAAVVDGGAGVGHEAVGVLDALGQRQAGFPAARNSARASLPSARR